jgi:predicted nucleic acid-binding protein
VIVLDANVLIAYLEPSDPHHDRAVELLLNAETEHLGISAITLAEVLVGPARAGRLAEAKAVMRDLEMVVVPVTSDDPASLAALRAGTGLHLPDCCVLMAAEAERAALASFDKRLVGAASKLGHAVVS